MRIVATDDGIPLISVFKLVATGYAVATGVLFVPIMTLVALAHLIFMDAPKRFELLLAPFVAAVVIVVQGLVVGVVVVLGLAVFRAFRRIEVRREGAG